MPNTKTQNSEEKTEQSNEAKVETDATISNQKTAFFITPLGSDDSDIRRSTNGLIDAVIRPVLKENDIHLVPPHEIKNPGTITRQIVRHILSADLVIANLTGLNPNVMYELAIRHAKRKPIIIIAENGTKLPFDLAGERTIFYQNDMAGVVALAGLLSQTIPIALKDENPENPIYNGLESLIIQEEVRSDNDPIQGYIIEKLEQLSDSVAFLRNNITMGRSSATAAALKMPVKYAAGTPTGIYEYTIEFSDDQRELSVKHVSGLLGSLNLTDYKGSVFNNSPEGGFSSVIAYYDSPVTITGIHNILTSNGILVKDIVVRNNKA